MKINDGILPRRSSSVWSFTAAFVDRKGAQERRPCPSTLYRAAPRHRGAARYQCGVGRSRSRCANRALRWRWPECCGDIAADAEMIELRLVCPQAGFDIAQALSPCELRECHAQILIETREALDLVLAVVARNATPEGR